MKTLREKLTYANVVATLALVVAVGGGGALAATRALPKNSVGTRQIKNHAVTRAKIKIASLGTVPSAAAAVHAASADNAAHATTAESAAHATTADSAGHATSADHAAQATTAADAESLGGLGAASYAKAEPEPIHVVGAPGAPAFEDGCDNAGGDFGEIGFYKDGVGIVHLVGFASCPTSTSTVFTLPPGFRPEVDNLMAVSMSETTSGEVGIEPDGEVRVFGGTDPRLFGVTFRTSS